jgi:hypothetical protein
VFLANILNMANPIIAQTEPITPERSLHTAAAVMATHNDVPDLEQLDRELHDRQTIQIGVNNDVGDVAVDEQLSRLESDDLICRHPTVGATDP